MCAGSSAEGLNERTQYAGRFNPYPALSSDFDLNEIDVNQECTRVAIQDWMTGIFCRCSLH